MNPPRRKSRHAFEAIDPAQQRVYCTWEAWDAHIVPGHPEIADLQDEIRAAIAHPEQTHVRRVGTREWRSYLGTATRPQRTGEAIEVVCTSEGQVVAARLTPLRQLDGLAAAVEQLERGALGRGEWTASYDADADIARLRRPDAGPAVSHASASYPDFLLRLDAATGLLTGIDLVACCAHLDEHAARLRRLAGGVAALNAKRRGGRAFGPAELVSNFLALSPARLSPAAAGRGADGAGINPQATD